MDFNWFSLAVTFCAGVAGVAVGYGSMQQTQKDQDRRLVKVESKIDFQVGSERCDKIREECRTMLLDALNRIEAQISKNRDYVVDQFQDIARFMGKMNGK